MGSECLQVICRDLEFQGLRVTCRDLGGKLGGTWIAFEGLRETSRSFERIRGTPSSSECLVGTSVVFVGRRVNCACLE
jgi:hypothetical protein